MLENTPLNRLSGELVDCCYKIHQALGPGLLESVYEECFIHELTRRSIPFEHQKTIPLIYDGHTLSSTLRLDLVIDNQIVIELKAIERLLPIHEAQILTYLKLCDLPVGLLINFNVPLIKDGIRRFVGNNNKTAANTAR